MFMSARDKKLEQATGVLVARAGLVAPPAWSAIAYGGGFEAEVSLSSQNPDAADATVDAVIAAEAGLRAFAFGVESLSDGNMKNWWKHFQAEQLADAAVFQAHGMAQLCGQGIGARHPEREGEIKAALTTTFGWLEQLQKVVDRSIGGAGSDDVPPGVAFALLFGEASTYLVGSAFKEMPKLSFAFEPSGLTYQQKMDMGYMSPDSWLLSQHWQVSRAYASQVWLKYTDPTLFEAWQQEAD